MNIEFDISVEINRFNLTLSVEASGHIYRENYGADADGNRGEMRTFCDDLEISITDGTGKDIASKLEKKHPQIYETIATKAEEILFATFDEGSEPDYEEDVWLD